LGLYGADARIFGKAQSHLVVVILEALLKLMKVDFIKVFRYLRGQGLAPSLEDHSAASGHWEAAQVWTDVTACALMAFLLEAELPEYKRSRLFHAGMVRLNEIKTDVSVRLKTFRGAKKTSGDQDIGRYCWEHLEKFLQNSSGANNEKVQDTIELWKNS
jgi:hypothetical protein